MSASSRSPELLEERELFVFDARSDAEISGFFDQARADFEEWLGPSFGPELAYLTAAEYALSSVLIEPRQIVPVEAPIEVGLDAIRVSLAKANCLSIHNCVGRLAAPHEPQLTLADVTAFSGDVAKLQIVGLEPDQPMAPGESPQEAIGDIARAVDQLERAHLSDQASMLAQAIGRSGVLRLQGFLWAVKLTLPIYDLADAIDGSFRAFELNRPSGLEIGVPG